LMPSWLPIWRNSTARPRPGSPSTNQGSVHLLYRRCASDGYPDSQSLWFPSTAVPSTPHSLQKNSSRLPKTAPMARVIPSAGSDLLKVGKQNKIWFCYVNNLVFDRGNVWGVTDMSTSAQWFQYRLRTNIDHRVVGCSGRCYF